MATRKLRVGDRVEYTGSGRLFGSPSYMATGVVLNCNNDGPIGVRFDEYFSAGHTLNGACSKEHGWWVSPKDLDIIDESINIDVDVVGLLAL